MSVSIKTIEFQRREAHLSELADGPPFTVHGVALGSGDVTVGQSGIKKIWPAEELEKAADTLEGRSLVVDHDNTSRGVVGEVTKAGFKEGVGVIYEAELDEEDLAKKINNGRLEVSIRGKHIDVDEMEENEEGAKIVEGIKFQNLSIVPTGAAPSNTIELGETAELSAAELAAFTASLQEIEPSSTVQWDDNRGIVLSIDGDEAEVDIYEKDGDVWRSTGESAMVPVDDLEMWDVEDDDLGSMQEEDDEDGEEDEENEEDEQEEAQDIPDRFFFEDEESAKDFARTIGLMGAHKMEGGWMPGEERSDFMEWWDNVSAQSGHADDEEEEENEELQTLEVHTPKWSDKREAPWNEPALEDFTDESWDDLSDDEKSQIDQHFLVSKTGFPPENFTDLALPVVDSEGNLVLNALQNAKARASQVSGLSGDALDRVEDIINSLANEEFDANFSEAGRRLEGEEEPITSDADKKDLRKQSPERFIDEEENATHPERPRRIDDTGNEEGVAPRDPVSISLDLINKYLRIEGNHERDTVDNMLSWLFGATDLPNETMADFRVAAKRFLDSTPGTDSFSGIKVEQFRDWLLMHGDGSRGRREQEMEKRGGSPHSVAAPVHVLTGDDLQQEYKTEESEMDNATLTVINMTEEIEKKLAELNEPVAVEQSDLEELQQKADRFEEMSSTLEDLKERTDVLDEVDRSKVEELAESDDPVVVESSRYEQLSEEAEQVKKVYASALCEEMPAFSAEELAENFSIESLREKYEDQIGDLEDELEANPRSGDVDEEELEERANDGDDEEELSENDEVKEIQEDLKAQIREGL